MADELNAQELARKIVEWAKENPLDEIASQHLASIFAAHDKEVAAAAESATARQILSKAEYDVWELDHDGHGEELSRAIHSAVQAACKEADAAYDRQAHEYMRSLAKLSDDCARAIERAKRDLSEAVITLQCHLEYVLDDANFEKIDTSVWNRVSALASPERGETGDAKKGRR